MSTIAASGQGETQKLGGLSGVDRVSVLKAQQRMVSFFQAGLYQSMAAIAELTEGLDGDPELAFEAAAAEIGSALHLTRRAADVELGFALDLVNHPPVADALAAGRIDLRRARTIIYNISHLPLETARQVVGQVIGKAERMTSGQLYALIRRLTIQVNPEDAARRYEQALADRRVVMEASVEGTCHLLGMDLPPGQVEAILDRISRLARDLKRDGEDRTIDQLRADIFLDLITGRITSGRGGVIDLHVDLKTLTELSEAPGELAGYGPVIADIARQIAEQQTAGEWRWTLTDPNTRLVVSNGTTRRRPTTTQRRQIEARHRTCVFPGCRMPARHCDLDHRTPWPQGGATTFCNLAPLCRHHHHLRHRAGWTHQPLPGGDHLWRSPLGHRYTTSGLPPPEQ
ncbi:MAG: DUF222 domain-containing protein [Actinomycetota bacterium]